jgi:hypothetical protein
VKMPLPLDQRIRKNLEVIRDEFKLLFLKHPPMYHQRITSPLAITRAGWESFSSFNFSHMRDRRVYVAADESHLGVFFESDAETLGPPSILTHLGFADFIDLVHRLGFMLIRKPIEQWEAMSAWMDILHDLAELEASPILMGQVHVFFPPDQLKDMVPDEEGVIKLYEDEVDFFQMLDERSEGSARFPKHPAIGILGQDVFRASAAAIDLLLNPDSYFVWKEYSAETMPFDLADLVSKTSTIVPAQKTNHILKNDSLPDFLFAKTGVNNWKLRFRNGSTGEVEYGEFQHTIGFEYYCKLLQSGQKGLKAIDLSPRDVPSEKPRSSVGESEYWNDAVDEQYGDGADTLWQTMDKNDISDLEREIELLEAALLNDMDIKLKKELNSQLKNAKRDLKNRAIENPNAKRIIQAINRVKGSLRRVRNLIDAENRMPGLAKFLVGHVKQSGDGWRYSPEGQIQWYFTVPE